MPPGPGVGQEARRTANLSALLRLVHLQGPTTRAALTTSLGLNRSTIGALTRQLEALGLVTEVPPGEDPLVVAGRRSGRPSLVVTPRRGRRRCWPRPSTSTGSPWRSSASVGSSWTVVPDSTSVVSTTAQLVVETISQMVAELVAASPDCRVLGVGVSVPGAVRERDGLVRFAPNLGWVDEPFTELLGASLGLPVVTANDADLGALAEHLRGAAVGASDVAYINGSVGIGGGFFSGGVPLRGAMGFAGEIGHVMVDSGGERCRCGAIGCLETKVGENQLMRAAGRLPGGGPPAVVEVIEAADAGDARAQEAVNTAAHWLGVGPSPGVLAVQPRAGGARRAAQQGVDGAAGDRPGGPGPAARSSPRGTGWTSGPSDARRGRVPARCRRAGLRPAAGRSHRGEGRRQRCAAPERGRRLEERCTGSASRPKTSDLPWKSSSDAVDGQAACRGSAGRAPGTPPAAPSGPSSAPTHRCMP